MSRRPRRGIAWGVLDIEKETCGKLKKNQVKMVIAFIPVCVGGKPIPHENVKPFCGKPLVCWSIEALEACREVSKVVVAADSDETERVVTSRPYQKTEIFRCPAVTASDAVSAESVMIAYIRAANPAPDTCFMLVQATSPMTQARHFSEALALYQTARYDSVLSCVRNYRFFWNADGTSMNYDYTQRPSQQNFKGTLMENGALYINKVENILSSGNRLSGRIGIYEMPAYTGMEIEEPDDWMLLENLMRKHVLNGAAYSSGKAVKLFLCDVDGTLTDGGMYYAESGDELKKFNTRDGMGLQLLQAQGVKVGIITSENTKLVENRARKLKVDFLVQGRRHGGKLEAAQEICDQMGITLRDVAYVGDDVNCQQLLSAVGTCACPADAVRPVKEIPGIIVLQKAGGEGCVREFIDQYLLGGR